MSGSFTFICGSHCDVAVTVDDDAMCVRDLTNVDFSTY